MKRATFLPLMSALDSVRIALTAYKEQYPMFAYTALKKGDMVSRGMTKDSGNYIIDDPCKVRRMFRSKSLQEIRDFFYRGDESQQRFKDELVKDHGHVVPFSQAIERRRGACLEISLAVHLMDIGSWLVGGMLGYDAHMFTVSLQRRPRLIDPISENGSVFESAILRMEGCRFALAKHSYLHEYRLISAEDLRN